MHYFANFDQRVDSVKHRWVCCWLLVADCWLLFAGCWLLLFAGCWSPEHIVLSCLGSSAAKATGVALERGGAGGEPKVPLVHHPLYPTVIHHPVWYKWSCWYIVQPQAACGYTECTIE